MRCAPVLLIIVGGIFLLAEQSIESRDASVLGEKLCQAVVRSDANEAKRLIEQGAPANAVSTESGESVLMTAVITGDREILRLLLKNGADVNSRNGAGFTALMLAVSRADNLSLARELVGAGSEVNATSRHGITALMIALQRGDAAMVRLLREAGARPSPELVADADGRLPNGFGLACASSLP